MHIFFLIIFIYIKCIVIVFKIIRMYLFINNVLNAKRFSLEHNLEKEKKNE